MEYDHYIGLDWAQQNMAIARMTKHSDEVQVTDVRTDLEELKFYLKRLKGTKILTFEETNPAQWLFTELKPYVDEILVCDPYRNHLLKEGGKSDRADAKKLAKLLKGDLLKPIFHCTDEFIQVRKLLSGYDDLVHFGVKQKNQRSALFRSVGKKATAVILENCHEQFVLEGLDLGIEHYEKQKLRYITNLKSISRKNKMVQNLLTIPGLGTIGALTIAATVIDPSRFEKKQHFWSYCGLIRHSLMSGGKSYGKRAPRCSRKMKRVFKIAAMSCIIRKNEENPLFVYYRDLIVKNQYPEHQARHALARRIATLAFGVMKSGEKLKIKDLFAKKMN
jgi:transposase